jgi:anti-sigma B factor antagonist
MEIKVREKGPVTIISLTGRLDLATGANLKEHVKDLLEKDRSNIHLNMKGIDFINSSGLGALVSIMKEIRLRKGRMTLSDLANYVQEIFEITQLSHIFELFTSEEEALGSYQPATTH